MKYINCCKNCSKVTKNKIKKEFCSHKCEYEYKIIKHFDLKILWADAQILSCTKEYKKLFGTTLYNPIKILGDIYKIEPFFIYTYLKYNDENIRICECGNIIENRYKKFCCIECSFKYKDYSSNKRSWDERMGKDKADEMREKQSKRQIGEKHSKEWSNNIKKWYKDENNLKKFKTRMKEIGETNNFRKKVSDGLKISISNGYSPQNNGGRRKAKNIFYKDKIFRSNFELIYYIYSAEILHQEVEFEKYRIKYFDEEVNKYRIYITDFYNKTTNTVIEIKPSSLILNELKYKLKPAILWCRNNKLKYKIITEKKIKQYLNVLYNSEGNYTQEKAFKNVLRKYKKWIA